MKGPSNFKDIIIGRMDEYLQQGGRSFRTANLTDMGKAFVEFYVNDVLVPLHNLEESTVEDGLRCGGKNDCNVDFAAKIGKGYIIIQGKYKGKGQSLTKDEISNFFRTPSRLFDKEYLLQNANTDLQSVLEDFNEKSQARFILITSAKITESTEIEINHQLKDFKRKDIDFKVKFLEDVGEDYSRASSIDISIPSDVEIPIEKIEDTLLQVKPWAYIDVSKAIDATAPYRSIICTIKGSILKQIYQQYKESLFNHNIRGFLGYNIVNKEINNTLTYAPEKFYYYNNGISAICTDMDIKTSDKENSCYIVCNDFQIINGAQTTTCIADFKDSSKLDKVRVLLRITKAEDIKKESKGFNRDIISFTNSQTAIKRSDFRANDEIQLFLRHKFNGHLYKGVRPYKQIEYMPKRKQVNKEKNTIYLSLDTLARVLYAFRFDDPALLQSQSSFLFDMDEKYFDLFGENKEEVLAFSQKRLDETIGICLLWFKIEEILKQNQKKLREEGKMDSIEYQSYLAKWYFLWLFGYIMREKYSDRIEQVWKHLIKGDIFEEKNFINKWFKFIAARIQDTLDDEYRHAKKNSEKEGGKGFNLRNWLRSGDTIETLKSKFKRISAEELPLDL